MATQQTRMNGDSQQTDLQGGNGERLANALGWFSIGLGLAEVATPGKVAELIGVRNQDKTRALLRAYGVREITAGIGILTRPQPAGWLWSRVAGDLLDLSSLGSALGSRRTDRARAGAATAAVLGVTALDVHCAQKLSRSSGNGGMAKDNVVHVTKTIIVGRSPGEVYQFWHDFNNLAKFMKHVESIEVLGNNRLHWKAKTAAGKTVEWDAEIVEDEPNSKIAWRTVEGSDVEHSGSVYFEPAPGGRGTLVKVELRYSPPGGAIAATLAKLFHSEPGQQIEEDLRAFKQVMETGEVAKSDASIHAGMHPGRPPRQAAATA